MIFIDLYDIMYLIDAIRTTLLSFHCLKFISYNNYEHIIKKQIQFTS